LVHISQYTPEGLN